jgi:GAF domain-containing protein
MTIETDSPRVPVGTTLRSVMAELVAHHRVADHDPEAALTTITAAAVSIIDGVDYADVMLIDHDDVQSRAATAPVVAELDAVQRCLRRGPCLRAAVTATVVSCPDLAGDRRWPRFAAAATDAGVRSMLSVPLVTDRHGGAALNLMGSQPEAVPSADHALASVLASHASIALIAADRSRQFQAALASRDVIGQAKGIVMEQLGVDAGGAFELLVTISQETNTPVRIVAQRLAGS